MDRQWLLPSILGALGGSAVTGTLMLLIMGVQPPIAKASAADLIPCPQTQPQPPSPDAADAFEDPDNPGNEASMAAGISAVDGGTSTGNPAPSGTDVGAN